MCVLTLAIAMLDSVSPIREVPFTDVVIADQFWAPRQAANRTVSIPHVLKMCEDTKRNQNLQRCADGKSGGYEGYVFNDSDLYKSMESAAFALAGNKDPELDRQMDRLIAMLAKAQQPDGYLNSYYILNGMDKRFTNLRDNHELYCAGHLFEAGVAHFRATGKKNLLTICTTFADLLCATFGPGKRMGYPGHPETELALLKLWKATNNKKYFDLAKFFIDSRGSHWFATEHNTPLDQYDGTYWQDDVPITDHREIKGHAVRAAYLFSGVADLARETRDPSLIKMLDRVWRNNETKRIFVTGGIGPSGSNEGFTTDYDLPNLSAYQETCASIAMTMWAHRMGLLHGQARYWDVAETALYNGFLAGINLKGDRFFYVNPLASLGGHHRVEWFGCACCPPNVTRTLAALGQYAYAASDDTLYVNLYVGGSVKTKVGQDTVGLKVETNYPWDSAVKVTVTDAPQREVALKFRKPGWCDQVGPAFEGWKLTDDGYLTVHKTWRPGETLELSLEMPTERVIAHPLVKENAGRTAFRRGPIVYCFEQADNPYIMDNVYVPLGAAAAREHRKDLLGGVTVLKVKGLVSNPLDWNRKLYQAVTQGIDVDLVAVPYYAWDNRTPGRMDVWLPTGPKTPLAVGPESAASVSMSFVSGNATPTAINDGKPVEASNRHPGQLCHWWPHLGTAEWVQYTWPDERLLNGSKVYWFDDTGSGACRPPANWTLEYLDGETWKPVEAKSEYGTQIDRWIEVKFSPVKTRALRISLQLRPNWAAGIHEWQVTEEED